MNYGNFDKYPEKKVPGYQAVEGWESVRRVLRGAAGETGVLTAEFYPGVWRQELVEELGRALRCSMRSAAPCRTRTTSGASPSL